MSLVLVRSDAVVSEPELARLHGFHQTVFSRVLRLEKDPMAFQPDQAESSFVIVPLNKEGEWSRTSEHAPAGSCQGETFEHSPPGFCAQPPRPASPFWCVHTNKGEKTRPMMLQSTCHFRGPSHFDHDRATRVSTPTVFLFHSGNDAEDAMGVRPSVATSAVHCLPSCLAPLDW